jgi:hypothetical protein
MGRKLAYSYGEGTETVRRVQLGQLGCSRGPEGRILADGLNRGKPCPHRALLRSDNSPQVACPHG